MHRMKIFRFMNGVERNQHPIYSHYLFTTAQIRGKLNTEISSVPIKLFTVVFF